MHITWFLSLSVVFLCCVEQQKLRDVHGKRKLDDVSYRDGARKCLKTDAELETTVDMDIEETTGDKQGFFVSSLCRLCVIIGTPVKRIYYHYILLSDLLKICSV